MPSSNEDTLRTSLTSKFLSHNLKTISYLPLLPLSPPTTKDTISYVRFEKMVLKYSKPPRTQRNFSKNLPSPSSNNQLTLKPLVHPKISHPEENTKRSYHKPCELKKFKTGINRLSEVFSSFTLNYTFKIQGHNTCDSENAIYQLQCQQCPAK